MAIHPDLEGIEVTVCVDGEALEEYDAENDEVKHKDADVAAHHQKQTVTKYIKSITDREFTIELSARHPFAPNREALSFEVLVDNIALGEPMLWAKDYRRSKEWSYSVEGAGIKSGDGLVVAPLKFAKIETTSDSRDKESIDNQKAEFAGVGQIVVKVHRASVGIMLDKNSIEHSKFNEADVTNVHEKALKGESKSHAISLGSSQTVVKDIDWWELEDVDGWDYPRVIFKFKYRSEESLKQLLVIERTPSPEPAEPPVSAPGSLLDLDGFQNLTEDSKAQIGQLLKIFATAPKQNTPTLTIKRDTPAKIKRERIDDGESTGKRKRVKKRKEKVFIDLTDDGEEDAIYLD